MPLWRSDVLRRASMNVVTVYILFPMSMNIKKDYVKSKYSQPSISGSSLCETTLYLEQIQIHRLRSLEMCIKIKERSTSLYLEPFWVFIFCNPCRNVRKRIDSTQKSSFFGPHLSRFLTPNNLVFKEG